MDTTLESLKVQISHCYELFHLISVELQSQRDLYLGTRDLFIRHDRFSVDQVERLKKRIENTSVKLEGIRAALKENWQDEADRLTAMIEKDQATIAAQMSRRVFIRAWYVQKSRPLNSQLNLLSFLNSMWHELRVILHNRENALLTQAVQSFAREEHEYAENVANNWMSLSEGVENMPYE